MYLLAPNLDASITKCSSIIDFIGTCPIVTEIFFKEKSKIVPLTISDKSCCFPSIPHFPSEKLFVANNVNLFSQFRKNSSQNTVSDVREPGIKIRR